WGKLVTIWRDNCSQNAAILLEDDAIHRINHATISRTLIIIDNRTTFPINEFFKVSHARTSDDIW
ncbi:36613_t:CDS:2, partial [Gigaspora margarita]